MLRQILQLSVLSLVIGGLAACNKPAADPAAPSTDGATEKPQAMTESGAKAPEAKPFAVSTAVASEVTVGATGAITANIEAKDGYHINAEYPMNFAPEGSSEGVAFKDARIPLKDSLEKTACSENPEDACAAKASIPFDATADGKQSVAGTLAFSVCNPERCIIEKAKVSVDVNVLAAAK